MKRKLSLILAVIMCILTLASCSQADNYVPAGYKKASNDNADYTLYVPEGWTVDMSTGVTTAYATDRSSVSFIGFELDDTVIRFDHVTEGDGTENENATDTGAEDKDKIVSLDDYWAYYSKAFEDTFSDMEYVSEGENTVVSGIEAKKYVYKATVTGVKYVFLQVVAIKDMTVYIFTYTAKDSSYESHVEEVTEILGYLEIK